MLNGSNVQEVQCVQRKVQEFNWFKCSMCSTNGSRVQEVQMFNAFNERFKSSIGSNVQVFNAFNERFKSLRVQKNVQVFCLSSKNLLS